MKQRAKYATKNDKKILFYTFLFMKSFYTIKKQQQKIFFT